MSVQFGIWSYGDRQANKDTVEKAAGLLTPYGTDSNEQHDEKRIRILYRAFHTTNESHDEKQPYVARSGMVLTWDGRLDNREELMIELRDHLPPETPDVEIVAAAYEKWRSKAFAKLVGDWALSLWSPWNQSLFLAKDPVGTRPLYYSFDNDFAIWSTLLDPLLICSNRTFALDEEFIAGWLTFFPATHLTPYVGIHSVPPSSVVTIRHGTRQIHKYWDFESTNKIRYRTDAEYEEHFRTVFATSVRRRLRADRPVLAELSGGRDSTAIVCMADRLIGDSEGSLPRLDTISYYDDSEPNWNERPYFTLVEKGRGRAGWHIDVGSQESAQPKAVAAWELRAQGFAAFPNYEIHRCQHFAACVAAQGNRVVLSGVGGDETMGGVPTPVPELEDFVMQGQLKTFAHQLKVWSLQRRTPWLYLFWEATRSFFPPRLAGEPKNIRPPAWLQKDFVARHRSALTGYPCRTKLFGAMPSFQASLSTLNALQRQLGCKSPPLDPCYEKRYPYLDRNLLEFMLAIPREQLVRPSQRRSLMRRALVGIVPDEILNRKSKAFVARAPLKHIANHWSDFMDVTREMVSASLGIVDSRRIVDTLERARRGEEIPVVTLLRTVQLESWLRGLCGAGPIKLVSNWEPRSTPTPFKSCQQWEKGTVSQGVDSVSDI